MLAYIRNRHLLLTDLLLLTVAAYMSFVLRLDNWHLGRYWLGWAALTGIALTVIPASLYALHCYSRYWRYASVDELSLLAAAASLGAVLAGCLGFVSHWSVGGSIPIPRSVPIIFWLLALLAIAVPRMGLRLLMLLPPRRSQLQAPVRRTLVVGAGDAGEILVRALRRNPRHGTMMIGFVDDDPQKHGMRIHGFPVLGPISDLPRLIHAYHADQVIIAIANLPGKRLREITMLCDRAAVRTRIIPALHELIDERFLLSQVREVRIEDMLRREPVQTDTSAVRDLIRGRRVLVTGGGGSIGSELCRQVLNCEPAELVILGHGENSIFEIHNELNVRLTARTRAGREPCKLKALIADIRAQRRIHAVFAEHRPEIVFHAAAHKHVPLMEENPAEAVTNNLLGTRNVVEAAQAVGVQRFVMISSDKAVNPTSVMGATKRAAELVVLQAAAASGRPYVTVRFGNVLGSRGSVVLTFKKQIVEGGPVTVTHPEMRRYFMTIPEAVQLVLQAATIGVGGEVFALDMGEQIKILDLALDMIALSGLEVGQDIDVQFTGVRPGEKLYEELFITGEEYQRTSHRQIFIVTNASSLVPENLFEQIESLAAAALQDDKAAILDGLRCLVPEFRRLDEGQNTEDDVSALQARAIGAAAPPSL